MKTMNFSIWLHQLEYVRLITDNLKVVILCEIKSMWQIAIFSNILKNDNEIWRTEWMHVKLLTKIK